MFGIYVHWPFCASKCPYCDFNSHVREKIDEDAWREAYLREMRHYAQLTPGRMVDSIFFGGGTPSLMSAQTTQAIIDEVVKCWHVKNDIEITLEANPTSVEAEKFKAFRQAGVNRVSLGIQALNDPDLKFLGRQHNAAEAVAAIKIAASTFDRFSFDLIYARPQHTVEAWQAELNEALNYAVGHLSLYQLTIEPGTPFHTQHARGDFTIPNEDEGAALYEVTQSVLSDRGMPAYEVSNHARPGEESRHNLVYWRYGDYVGIGPGAHGRLTLDGVKHATRAHRAPEIWLERVQGGGHGAHPHETVAHNERLTEALMMGLRLQEGVPLGG
ncbi:MAG: radical SAM family heme chaperone HemW [Alphaproteobacteria bacterium]|nr:radical SAM family heme chaperone HemW [Alphaproteobacteria bacterium]